MAYPPIEHHGMIGDLHTIALVALDGSIDYLCFPHFDSPSVFAALLDEKKGGCFRIDPLLDKPHRQQFYLPATNILVTRFLADDAAAEITDFMCLSEEFGRHTLVRIVKAIRGRVRFRFHCEPRFNYARSGSRIEDRDGDVLFTSKGPDETALRLHIPVEHQIRHGAVVADFTLDTDRQIVFTLDEPDGGSCPASTPNFVERACRATTDFWHDWIGRCTYTGRWREMVHRSALTLKMLVSRRHGSIIAAPTFSMPERIGGERNWDYRYTWIRDAAFTIYALLRLGYSAEARHFMEWLAARCDDLESESDLHVLYALDGRRNLHEETLDHLEGYRGTKPVRIGNEAYHQLQLDAYGELMNALYLYYQHGEHVHHDLWAHVRRLTDWLAAHWRRPDHGIWEVRGLRREFLYSRLMSWVALDRGTRLALNNGLPAPIDRWMRTRDDIYHDIMTNFWSGRTRSFVQYKGAESVDAALLRMPLVEFIAGTDPRWRSTMRQTEREIVSNGLVRRHLAENGDAAEGEEISFNMATFWYVSCLASGGELHRARLCFEQALTYANHVGLYGEQLGRRGEHLGNFPQALTHLALIKAADDLDTRLNEAGERG